MTEKKMCDKCNVKMLKGSKRVSVAWGGSYMKDVLVCPKCGKIESIKVSGTSWSS